MASTKKVAIIGAGASGITGIKCCLDENLEPVCFERTDHIGGLWYYTEDAVEHQACVMKSTVINTSKEMMSYSDLPIPKEYPNYMHNRKVLEYFSYYVEKFNLQKYIKFKTEILSVRKAENFKETGEWVLEIKDLETGNIRCAIFSAVLICTGHHAEKNVPKFDGIEKFKGKIVHTHDYKNHKGYEDKRVVVIGIGNSGGDLSVELGKMASQVYLSTRSGTWVLHRVGPRGMPIDILISSRFAAYLRSILPERLFNAAAEKEFNKRLDHELYGLKPNYRLLSQHPMVNDDLPNKIISGAVKIKPNVKKIHETCVEFEDGSIEENIDAIILATGYIFGFPFLQEGIINVVANKVDLFKFIFPPDLEKSTLAVLGCIQPWGAIMPIAEMQCRWAVKVFKGDRQLPSTNEMWDDIKKTRSAMEARYVARQRHTIQVEYVPYMDQLAEQVGCKPDILMLLKNDFSLAMKVIFDGATPYQYRLHGPHAWEGARDAIMTQWDRIHYPLATRKVEDTSKTKNNYFFIILIVVLAFFIKFLFF